MDGILLPLLLTLHIFVGLIIIGLVLIQHGKGADMGAAFGGGSSGSLFGSSGSANFMSRTTAVLATIFFLTSLGLSYLATNRAKTPSSVLEQMQPQPSQSQSKPTEQPALPAQQPAQPGVDSKAKDIPK